MEAKTRNDKKASYGKAVTLWENENGDGRLECFAFYTGGIDGTRTRDLHSDSVAL